MVRSHINFSQTLLNWTMDVTKLCMFIPAEQIEGQGLSIITKDRMIDTRDIPDIVFYSS